MKFRAAETSYNRVRKNDKMCGWIAAPDLSESVKPWTEMHKSPYKPLT